MATSMARSISVAVTTPVDVTAIEFGPASVNSIRATLVAKFDFEFELRDLLNLDLTLSADLTFRRG